MFFIIYNTHVQRLAFVEHTLLTYYLSFNICQFNIGDCFNMKWQPLEVALAYAHG